MYRSGYWQAEYFYALDILREASKKHGLTEAECALRWISHHSLLNREHGNVIIIGASSSEQLENDLVDLEKGPFPEEVLIALNEGWAKVKGISGSYFH